MSQPYGRFRFDCRKVPNKLKEEVAGEELFDNIKEKLIRTRRLLSGGVYKHLTLLQWDAGTQYYLDIEEFTPDDFLSLKAAWRRALRGFVRADHK
jgi:hypothetical protein